MNFDEKITEFKGQLEKAMLKMQAVLENVERLQNLYNSYTYIDYITDENGTQLTERKFYNEDDKYKWSIIQKTIENLMK